MRCKGCNKILNDKTGLIFVPDKFTGTQHKSVLSYSFNNEGYYPNVQNVYNNTTA
jgi:hypothetical protein